MSDTILWVAGVAALVTVMKIAQHLGQIADALKDLGDALNDHREKLEETRAVLALLWDVRGFSQAHLSLPPHAPNHFDHSRPLQ